MTLIRYEDYEPRHLSFSTADGYKSCGTRFYLQKIARVEQRPGVAGTAGNAFHEATEDIDHLILAGGFEALDPPEASEDDPPPF